MTITAAPTADRTAPTVAARIRTIAYWGTTLLVVAESAVGGVWDIQQTPYVREILTHLGYPLYLLVILGIVKLPAAVVLVAPRVPLLKEWAYAGIFFVYMGAVASHVAVGDRADQVVPAIVLAGLTVASWALRPASRRTVTGSRV